MLLPIQPSPAQRRTWMCWAGMGRNRCFSMNLFAPGRDIFGFTAPDYNRVKGCFREQYNFSLLIDSQIATIHPLTCHKSAKNSCKQPNNQGQIKHTASPFS